MIKMQESLEKMATSLQSNQALHASSLVGRTVLAKSNKLSLGEVGNSTEVVIIDLPAGVRHLSASIYSKTGELIKNIALGQPQMEIFQFVWDGSGRKNQREIAGNYIIKVTGVCNGQEVILKTMTSANIDSVSLGQQGEGLKLNVAGIGLLSLDEVQMK